MDKLEIARRQLGTALYLFIRDQDPVSIQCLACGGCEIVEALAKHQNVRGVTDEFLEQWPELDLAKFRKLRSHYWNAFKHVYSHNQRDLRDDSETISKFSDIKNDVALLIGWSDYYLLSGKLPIAAQVFQTWYFALYPEWLAANADSRYYNHYFPDLPSLPRKEQKRRLRRMVEKYEHHAAFLADYRTDPTPLLLRGKLL